jgi:hypothetical protein
MRKITGWTVIEENAFNNGDDKFFATEGGLSKTLFCVMDSYTKADDWRNRIDTFFSNWAMQPKSNYYKNRYFIVKEVEITIK